MSALLDSGPHGAVSMSEHGEAVVRPARRLRGTLRLPGDKSISHRALLLAALADGTSRISGAGDGGDVRTTARLAAALGADVDATPAEGGRSVDYEVRSPGARNLVEPDDVLDCANSGTSLRLLAGVVAARPWSVVLTGDASLRARPVRRIVDPLRAMGAELSARHADSLPPLAVRGRSPLRAIDHSTAVPSAQVKSAILLAALGAEGVTTVTESVATRDHTERMLRARGVRVEAARAANGAMRVAVEGGQVVNATDETVPGDVSAAAFWLVAAAIHPDAELVLDRVGLNPTRTAVIELLRRMGADIDVDRDEDAGWTVREPGRPDEAGSGEPAGRIRIRSSALRAIDVDRADVAAAIDEIPVLCLAATQAVGTTRIRGAGELRVKESDRIAGIADGLRALGVDVEVAGDDILVTGPRRLTGGIADARLDHRLAMTFAIAGLVATGDTAVASAAAASVSYPRFFDDLGGVQA